MNGCDYKHKCRIKKKMVWDCECDDQDCWRCLRFTISDRYNLWHVGWTNELNTKYVAQMCEKNSNDDSLDSRRNNTHAHECMMQRIFVWFVGAQRAAYAIICVCFFSFSNCSSQALVELGVCISLSPTQNNCNDEPPIWCRSIVFGCWSWHLPFNQQSDEKKERNKKYNVIHAC